MPHQLVEGSWDQEAWPAYVDFLSTFAFVLFIFIGSLLFVMYGGLSEHAFAKSVSPWVQTLKMKHIDVAVEGRKIRFDLRDHVDFSNNSAELQPAHIAYLKQLARELPTMPEITKTCNIVVLGKADAAKYHHDPFGNWNLSARRALTVLQTIYNCEDCGYGEKLRDRLVLLGEGDVNAANRIDPQDRRVDIVIDCTHEIAR